MAGNPHENLSRRERQIMEIVYRLGEATAAVISEKLADPPSYSAVRSHLRILEDKGHLKHRQDGPRYVYLPTVPRSRARTSALRNLLCNFFEGSREQMIAALLDDPAAEISDEELERLSRMIDRARQEGR
jgi:predicted transcriptional regulator